MSSPISIQALSLLKAIITERSLSRAEENLCISRSTANRMMHGLRKHFGDPLYMRTREGLSPTRAALTLLPYIQRLERSYHQIVSIKPFDPATSMSEVTVGLLGDDSDCLVSELIDLVRLNAPHVTLKFIHISEDRFEMLREGRLDFVISSLPGSIGKPFHTLPLASSRFVLVCSPEHPLASLSKPISDRAVTNYPFIDVFIHASHKRELVLRHEFFPQWSKAASAIKTHLSAAIGASLTHHDALMVIPERIARILQRAHSVVILSTRSSHPPVLRHLIWHESTHDDPAMQWLRAILSQTALAGKT